MATIARDYSPSVPILPLAAVPEPAQETFEDRFESLSRQLQQDLHYQRRWQEIAIVVSAVGLAGILVAAGVLPVAAFVGAALSVPALLAVQAAIPCFAKHVFDVSIYNDLTTASPIMSSLFHPIYEELIFRVIIQQGLYIGLSYVLPAVTITLLGFQLPVAAVVSIVAAGVLFGLAHAHNHPGDLKKNIVHTVFAMVGGVFVFGPLYHAFGFCAVALAHIVNNLAIDTFFQLTWPQNPEEAQPAVAIQGAI